MSEFYTVVTQKGIEELQNCLNANQTFNAVFIGIGDSNGSYYEPEENQSALKNEVYRGQIYARGKRDNYIYFDMQLPPSEGDYVIREAGVFDSNNNLLAVSKYPETLKTKATGDNVTILNIEIQIELSTSAINTIVIEETGNLVTKEDLQDFANTIHVASKVDKGIVKIGENIYVEDDGTISVKQTSGFQLFDLVQKDHILSYEESEGFTRQGDWAYAEPIEGEHFGYSDFYNKCLEEKSLSQETRTVLGTSSIVTYNHSNGHIYYDIADKPVVDTYFENNGIAWFYGIDEENKRIFMPRNKYFFRNSTDSAGGLNLPGAPSINHNHPGGSLKMNISGTLRAAYEGLGGTGDFETDGYGPYNQGGQGSYPNKVKINVNKTLSGTTANNSSVNNIYGREQNQIMVTSSNTVLYIVTGTVIRDYANVVSSELENAIADINKEKQTCINALNLVGSALSSEFENIFNNSVDSVQNTCDEIIENASLQADRATEQAEIAKRYANMAVSGQIQADWEQTNSDAVDYIQNKPDFITKSEIENYIKANKTNIIEYFEFYMFDWSETENNFYEYKKEDIYGVFGVYKNENGRKVNVLNIDIEISDEGVILTSLEPFDGFIFGIKSENHSEEEGNQDDEFEEDEDDNEFSEEELEALIIKDFDEF